jgi:arylsulfatase A-like enzyme
LSVNHLTLSLTLTLTLTIKPSNSAASNLYITLGSTDPHPQGSSTPFFLYVAFAHTHTPLAYRKEFEHASPRPGFYKVFGNTLAEVDHAIGSIVDAVDAAGLGDDTLIWLTADNGPADLGSVACEVVGQAGPFIGAWQRYGAGGGGSTYKATTWEGGHRMVGIARWKSKLKPRTSHALASTLDFMPTFAALAGVKLPSGRSYDGKDLSAVLLQGDDSAGHDYLFHPEPSGNLTAARAGKYKAYWKTASQHPCIAPSGVQPGAGKTLHHDPPLVFDLDQDPGESTPVTPPQHVLQALQKQKEEKMADIVSTFRGEKLYQEGGRGAEPCCNEASAYCGCDGA